MESIEERDESDEVGLVEELRGRLFLLLVSFRRERRADRGSEDHGQLLLLLVVLLLMLFKFKLLRESAICSICLP